MKSLHYLANVDLVRFSKPFSDLIDAYFDENSNRIPRDSKENAVYLGLDDLVNVYQKYVDAEITEDALIAWADAIVVMGGIDFEEQYANVLNDAFSALHYCEANENEISKTFIESEIEHFKQILEQSKSV